MRIIGLTGGIASGKSTVSAMLKSLGAKIIDADLIARSVVEPGQPAWQDIKNWLGDRFFLPDGNLDRRKVGDYIFNDDQARGKLEDITHHRIQAAVRASVEQANQENVKLVVIDVPLLFETGWQHMVDETWLAYVGDEVQIDRLIKRDGITLEQAQARIASQMKLKDKVALADVVIDNSADMGQTRRQVETAWAEAMNKV